MLPYFGDFEAHRVAGATDKQLVWAARFRVTEIFDDVALPSGSRLEVVHMTLLAHDLSQLIRGDIAGCFLRGHGALRRLCLARRTHHVAQRPIIRNRILVVVVGGCQIALLLRVGAVDKVCKVGWRHTAVIFQPLGTLCGLSGMEKLPILSVCFHS